MTPILESVPGQPPPQGEAVEVLQQLLLNLGILKRAPQTESELSTKTFGAYTVEAVREFQTDRGLKVDGIVGPITWRALNSRETTQPYTIQPDYTAMNLLEAEVIHVAWGEFNKGVKEVPFGSNRGPDVDRYLKWTGDDKYLVDHEDPSKGAAWCGLFGAACIHWACQRLQKPNPDCPTCKGLGASGGGCSCLGWNPVRHWGSGAWVPAWWTRAAKDGCIAQEVAPGHVVLLGSEAHLRHLVLATWVNPDAGTFGTVEGNSDNAVRARVRRFSEVGVSIKLPMPKSWERR